MTKRRWKKKPAPPKLTANDLFDMMWLAEQWVDYMPDHLASEDYEERLAIIAANVFFLWEKSQEAGLRFRDYMDQAADKPSNVVTH